MLKNYEFKGLTYQFEEGKQPDGAVEVKTKVVIPKSKPAKTANKTRRTAK